MLLNMKPGLRTRWFLVLLSLILIFAVYSPVTQFDFLNWDDDNHLLNNRPIQNLSLQHIHRIFTQSISSSYIPLTSLSFAVEYYFFGRDPAVYHLTNLLLHLAVCLLVFVLARQLGLDVVGGIFAMLIFGLHPLRVESVAWVTERKDVLCAFFYLLSVCGYVQYRQRSRRLYLFLALCSGLLSVLAKPMALSLPWILLLFDHLQGRKLRSCFPAVLAFFLVVEPVALVTYLQHTRIPEWMFPQSVLLWVWCGIFYLHKFFLPLLLFPFYEIPQPIDWHQPQYLGSALLFVVLVLGLVVFRRRRWYVFAGLSYFGSIFFLWCYDQQGVNMVADRFMYLPSLGICLALGNGMGRLWRSRPVWGILVMMGVLVFCAVRTRIALRPWKNSVSFWEHVVSQRPDLGKAHVHLAEAYGQRGLYRDAYWASRWAVMANPDIKGHVLHNQALLALKQGRWQQALNLLEQELALSPGDDEALRSRGDAFQYQGDRKQSRHFYSLAIAAAPHKAEHYISRGVAHAIEQEYQQALIDFSMAVKKDPYSPLAYYNRALALWDLGQQAAARQDLDQALFLDRHFDLARRKKAEWQKGI